MPVRTCRADGKPGYRWGNSGKCYTYTSGDDGARREAKRKAIIQGIAAGERPASHGVKLSAELELAAIAAEEQHLAVLAAFYEQTLRSLGSLAANQFALTAAADWQPPAEGAALSAFQLAALAESLNTKASPMWRKILLDVAAGPLGRIGIAWDVKHPLVAGQLDKAAQRTGRRLGEAVQPVIREALAQAYEAGLPVPETAKLITAAVNEAAPWQAEMLARTDLNSLANGASKSAARLTGMNFKTWVATLDEKTRPEHADAHGQTVPIDDVFDVGGEDADYPGDPNLSDAMAANCRCTLAYGETLAEAEALLADGGTPMAKMRQQQRGGRNARVAAARRTNTKTAQGNGSATDVFDELTTFATPVTLDMWDRLDKTGPVDLAVTAAARPVAFSGTAAIEGKISDDNSIAPRILLPNALAWPEMPVPFMAQTVTAEGHDGAEVSGRVDEFARRRATGKMQNIEFSGELTTPFGINEIAPMIEDKTLRYVSVDLGASDWKLVNRTTLAVIPETEFDIAQATDGAYALGLTAGKIKAVTLVPTQAIEGALVALVASADTYGVGIGALDDGTVRVVAPLEELNVAGEGLTAAAAPVAPPAEWFETPEPPGRMPLTISEDGRVYGHLATWDSCHVGFLPRCVPPPKSDSNYAYFHVCELDTSNGSPVTVGKLMFSPSDGGHADRTLTAAKASAYYDRTGLAAAFLRVSDGEHGIWAAGSLSPDLSDAQRQEMRRQLRLHPPSGDWRPINGQYELICALAVAVPGFPTPRATVTITAAGEELELEDAIIASSGVFTPDPEAVAALEELGLVDEELQAEQAMGELVARANWRGKLAEILRGDR